ncbi:MAG: hypothetical protein M1830_007386 [Pleopsidium flavum]|nr:MAG: hypothetical protein M1830_007386 [Pleopsidium flavum]
MAPRREKSEKASADQGAAMILDYLRKQKLEATRRIVYKRLTVVHIRQRTYLRTCTIRSRRVRVACNKHKEVVREAYEDTAHAAKTLKEMHERNEIAGRAAGTFPAIRRQQQTNLQNITISGEMTGHILGKQTVYHALQDPNDIASPEEVAAMDREIETIREEIVADKANEKLLKANLAAVNATVSTEDLRGNIITLELEKEQLLARLVPLRSGRVKPVPLEEKMLVDKAWKEWQRKWDVRKKIAMEVWAHATEVLPEGTSKEELWEGLGLELDP